jgi:hypothetical protein
VEVDSNAPVVRRGETLIAADPDTVWGVMADIDGWPRWNGDVRAASLQGPLQPGTRFRWKAGPGTITSTLVEVDRPSTLGWTGSTMGIKAVDVYRFRPDEDHPGHTVVRTEESWNGLLVRLLPGRLAKTLGASIHTGLERLKAEAERRAASS